LRIKEQETLLTLHEHDDDDDETVYTVPSLDELANLSLNSAVTKEIPKHRIIQFKI
jgi:hypothetical protein